MNKCLECSKETKNVKFCSRSCSVSYNNRLYPKRLPTHYCRCCGKPINSKVRYCSKECKIAYKIQTEEKNTCILCKNKLCAEDISYNGYCKRCNRLYGNERREKNKKELINYLGGKCYFCGYNKYFGALHFHHRDPSTKKFAISQGGIKNISKIKDEVDKCILVCANCHAELHAGLLQIN